MDMSFFYLMKDINFTLDPKILWIVFIAALIIASIFAAVLLYHWITYSYAPKQTKMAVIIFGVGAGLLIVIALASIITFTLSTST